MTEKLMRDRALQLIDGHRELLAAVKAAWPQAARESGHPEDADKTVVGVDFDGTTSEHHMVITLSPFGMFIVPRSILWR